MRKEWGCDEPSKFVVVTITCPRCDGRDADCERCSGQKTVDLHRCPQSHGTHDIASAMTHFHQFSEHGVLPYSGLLGDQSAGFFAFTGEVGAERARIDAAQKRQDDIRRRSVKHGG